jgi:hypothetical protein
MRIVSIVDPHSSIVPPSSILPFLARVSSSDKKLLWYEGDIHNRMPVVLDAADWQTWLGEVPASSDELQALLQQPYPAECMTAHEIGPEIGNVKSDNAALIERVNSV